MKGIYRITVGEKDVFLKEANISSIKEHNHTITMVGGEVFNVGEEEYKRITKTLADKKAEDKK